MMGRPGEEFTVRTIDIADHERSDAHIRPLGLFLAGLVASLVFVGLLVWLLFDVFLATINPPPAGFQAQPLLLAETGQPLLQVRPSVDMQTFRQQEQRMLGATEWIDREKGIARIPIAAAMKQIETQGLPKWPAVAPQAERGGNRGTETVPGRETKGSTTSNLEPTSP